MRASRLSEFIFVFTHKNKAFMSKPVVDIND